MVCGSSRPWAASFLFGGETIMITRLSHTTLYVLDQDEALAFYRDKLGFEVRRDLIAENGFRWLAVGSPTQPDMHIVLMSAKESPWLSADKANMLRTLIESEAMASGVLEVEDCHRTYEELKAKGVEFMTLPTERPYGIEALLKDNSGNWFNMVGPGRKS
jgi:catechol 2,3-dioxygenase-like lactoylglutathione lyase family enzyme